MSILAICLYLSLKLKMFFKKKLGEESLFFFIIWFLKLGTEECLTFLSNFSLI